LRRASSQSPDGEAGKASSGMNSFIAIHYLLDAKITTCSDCPASVWPASQRYGLCSLGGFPADHNKAPCQRRSEPVGFALDPAPPPSSGSDVGSRRKRSTQTRGRFILLRGTLMVGAASQTSAVSATAGRWPI
jgi:hypothetical protein